MGFTEPQPTTIPKPIVNLTYMPKLSLENHYTVQNKYLMVQAIYPLNNLNIHNQL